MAAAFDRQKSAIKQKDVLLDESLPTAARRCPSLPAAQHPTAPYRTTQDHTASHSTVKHRTPAHSTVQHRTASHSIAQHRIASEKQGFRTVERLAVGGGLMLNGLSFAERATNFVLPSLEKG